MLTGANADRRRHAHASCANLWLLAQLQDNNWPMPIALSLCNRVDVVGVEVSRAVRGFLGAEPAVSVLPLEHSPRGELLVQSVTTRGFKPNNDVPVPVARSLPFRLQRSDLNAVAVCHGGNLPNVVVPATCIGCVAWRSTQSVPVAGA